MALSVTAPAPAAGQTSDPATTQPTTTEAPGADRSPSPPQTVPDGLGNSLPRPTAGPEPDDAGDRGGWLQFALLAAMVAAASFVLSRLFRTGRRARP